MAKQKKPKRTWVVAVISFFDNEIKQYQVLASTETSAMLKGAAEFGSKDGVLDPSHKEWLESMKKMSPEELRQSLVDGEMDVTALEIV